MGVAPTFIGDLDGREPNAARGCRYHERVALRQPGDVDQGPVGRHVLHPDRRGFLPRERGGMRGHGTGRSVGKFAIEAVGVQAESRNGADRIANIEPLDVGADRGDRARRLVAQAGGELRVFQVLAATKHRLGAVEAQGLDADLDFAFAGSRNVELLDLEDLGTADLVESDDSGHGWLLLDVGLRWDAGIIATGQLRPTGNRSPAWLAVRLRELFPANGR
jgi:hypothetical protein